jgi:uncharacterized delta-60 repeat protein
MLHLHSDECRALVECAPLLNTCRKAHGTRCEKSNETKQGWQARKTMEKRSGVLSFVAMFALLFSFLPTAVAQHVNTAPTFFAGSGSVVAGLPNVYETGNAVAVQPDGKILVGGNSSTIIDPTNWIYGENLLLLARFNVDGSLDTSFGSNGYATVNVWTSDYLYEAVIGISVLSNGKIVVGVGDAYIQHEGQPGFGAARFNADGSIDTSFGNNGVRLVSSTSGQDTAHSMTLDAAGNILIVGESPNSPSRIFVARITPAGNLDTSFGIGGIVTTLVGTGNSLGNGIAVQSDGKIVVTGTSWSGSTTVVTVLRYNSTGTIDTTFGGGDGIATFDVAPSYDTGMAVAIQGDGKIVVGGHGVSGTLSSGGDNMDFVVLRLNSDGTLDTTFNTTGTRLIDLGNSEQFRTISIQPDGKILLAGQSGFKAAFVRLASDGSLDETFNGTGILTTSYDGNGIATALQDDGRIVSIGSVSDPTGTYSDLTLLRLDPDGSADTSFGLNPVSTLDNAPIYVQGSFPVVLDGNVSIYDAELSNANSYNGATLTLSRQGGANAGDIFGSSGTLGTLTQGSNLAVGGTVIGTVTTNSAGTLLLTFTGNSTQSLVNAAMRQIVYSNNNTVSPASIPLNWTFSDGNTGSQGTGGALSASGSITVSIVAAAPTVVTGTASSISSTGATLNGNVSDNGANATVSFEYGQTTAYGSNITASPGLISAGSGSTNVSATISGLSCNTTYHFRVRATNSVATTNGDDSTFTTNACAPGAPTIGTATAGDAQATITFTAPASNGGATISGYTATSNPGGLTGTGAASPITVTGLANGTAYTFAVTATNSAGTGAASAASNSVTPKASQTITFNNPGSQNFGTSPTLTATATSGLTVTFSSSTTGVCTVTAGGALTFISVGTCTIGADQAGNGAYAAAPTVTRSFTINAVVPGAPAIGTATTGDAQATITFTAPASNGGAAIIGYTATSNPGGLTGTGAASPITVTGLTNGTAYSFTVTATNSAGTGSASSASNSVTPKASQTITFNNPGAQNFGTSPTLTATATSGLSVTFSSSTTGVCTVTTGGALTFVSVGTCTISADQAGNNAFLAAPTVTRSFTINAVVPGAPAIGTATAGNAQASISFVPPPFTGGATITSYTATSNPGGLTGTGAASPIAVTGLTNGVAYTFTVTATNSAGTGAASAASNSVTPKASQTITFNNPGAQNFGTSPTLTATATSGLSVTFSSSTTGVCTVTAGGALTFISVGTCTINADQAGNGSYSSAPTVTGSFSVVAVVPGAPTGVAAAAGDRQVSVSFTAPSFTGGADITSYTAVSDPGGITSTGTTSPIIITGLTNGIAYTFTVTAASSAGTGPASAASSSVTPVPDIATPLATVASNIVLSGFTANWNSVPGAASYHLDVATDSSFSSMVSGYSDLDVGNVTSKAVTDLPSGTTYFYRVRAYSSTSTSFASNIITVITATPRTVTNTNDSGPGSLRQAIADGNPSDVISFAEELNGETITLVSPLVTSEDVTINGPDAANLTISGNQAVQIFQVSGATRLTLQHLTLANGNVNGSGGALADNSSAEIAITGCTFSNNAASDNGGALALHGTITITDSLFTGNRSDYHGGAIYQSGATLTLTNVTLSGNTSVDGGAIHNLAGTTSMINATVANNSSAGQGGGITVAAGIVTLKNSIVANNSAAASGPDVYGPVTSQGYNLLRNLSGTTFVTTDGDLTAVDPVLGTLADNGGRTQTMALLSGSPAINAGTCAGAPTKDQRGMARPQDGACDMGAYERGAPAELADISGTPQSTLAGTEFAAPLHLKVLDSMGAGLEGVNVSFAGPASGAGIAANGSVVTDATGAAEYAVSANATPGAYTVTATAGTLSTDYSLTNDAPLAQTISSITFNPPNLTVGGETIASATADSGLPVSFTSLTPTICGVSGAAISGLHVGTCTVRAEQPGSISYLPAPPVDQDLQVTYSTNPPVLTVSALSEGAITANSTQNISGVASDPGGIQSLTINDKPIQVYEDGSFTYPVQLLLGSNSITLVATNHANISTTDTRTITLNSTAPILWINNPPDNASLSQQHITCNGTIPSGNTDPISSVQYSVNGSSLQLATLTGSDYSFPADLQEGMNTIRVFASTGSGMTVEAKRTVFYAPGVSLGITNPVEDIRTPLGTYTITGSVTDNATPVEVTITVDNLTFTPAVANGIFQQQINFSNNKVYQLAITAIDQNNNRVVTRRNIIRGDSLSNGTGFTMADAVEAMQISLGLISPSQSEILRLDVAPLVNGVSMSDGKVDIEDAVVILRMAVGAGQ